MLLFRVRARSGMYRVPRVLEAIEARQSKRGVSDKDARGATEVRDQQRDRVASSAGCCKDISCSAFLPFAFFGFQLIFNLYVSLSFE